MSYNYPYSCPQRRYSPVPDRYYHPQPRQYSQSSPSYWNHRPLQYTPDVAATTQVIYPTHYNYPANNAAQQQHSAWAADAAHPLYRPGSANFVNTTSALGYPDESSQRTILTPSPHYSAPIHVLSHHHKNDLPRSPSLSPDYSSNNSWGDVLDDSSQSSRQPSAPLAPSTPFVASTHFVQAPSPIPSPNSVKEEPDDGVGRFIMELSAPQVQSTFLSQSLAPPTEVPLRATQAPPEMRSMMGVFRLNPFAMHSGEGRGIVAPTWCGEEAHPLDEEPIIFEFQVDLEDGDVTQISEQPKESLRAFSPNFELDHGRDELERDQNGWREYNSESAYASTPPTWELDYPPNEEQFSSSESEPPATYSQPRQSSRLYEISQHYLQKNAEHPGYTPACYPTSTPSIVSAINAAHRMRPPEASWSRAGCVPASRSIVYAASDSPGCHSAVLPSITTSNRRWSLPDSNSNYHAPFLG